MNTKIRIGIAEDHLLFRKSICNFLNATGRCLVVLEQKNGADIIANIEKHQPDVLLLDLQMPEIDGFETLKLIRAKKPLQKVIIYSSLYPRNLGLKVFGDAIQDYLPKHTSPDGILASVLRVSDA